MVYPSKILIYLAIIHNGEWGKIYKDITTKNFPNEEEAYSVVDSLKCKAITIIDDEYPRHLSKIARPPFVLFYYGDINLIKSNEKNLSVVGSRNPDEYIIEPTRQLLCHLARKYTIVSGLAIGVDTLAHQATLDVGGKTVAVLAHGIDYVYPSVNIPLYEKIKETGLVISEYPYDIVPERQNFPFRNRIIAALGKGLFIPAIHFASGTYSTLSYALNQGREIFILPHKPFSSTANNRLINEGATLVNTPDDIIDVLG